MFDLRSRTEFKHSVKKVPNGPFQGLVAGEIGLRDFPLRLSNLGVETSRGIDVSLRKKSVLVTGSVSGYYNSFSDFIDFAPTGQVEDGLQVFDYTPKNAEFFGGEAQIDFHLLPLTITGIADQSATDPKSVKNVITGAGNESQPNPNDLFLRFQSDYTHAQDSDTGEPLPRITPLRYSVSLTTSARPGARASKGSG